MKPRYRNLLLLVPIVLLGIALLIRSRRPQNVPGIGAPATVIAFSPDGKTLVCASANDYVQMWFPEQNKWRSFRPDSGTPFYGSSSPSVTQLRFSGNGRTLVARGTLLNTGAHYSYAWEVPSRKIIFDFAEAHTPAFDVTRDEKYAAVGFNSGVSLMDLKSKPPKPSETPVPYRSLPHFRQYRSHMIPAASPTSAAFSPDGKTLAIAGGAWSWNTAFWDVATRKPLPQSSASPVAFGEAPKRMEWSPDGTRLAAIWAGKIAIWDTARQSAQEVALPTSGSVGAPRGLPVSPSMIPPALAWAPDGKTLFSGGDEVRQWDASNLQLERHFGIGGPVAVSPDGKTLATANIPRSGAPHGIWLWKLG